MSNETENPVDWCQRMLDSAPNGQVAMHYFNLKEFWVSKQAEGNEEPEAMLNIGVINSSPWK